MHPCSTKLYEKKGRAGESQGLGEREREGKGERNNKLLERNTETETRRDRKTQGET